MHAHAAVLPFLRVAFPAGDDAVVDESNRKRKGWNSSV
jgi:hypothetical protein